MSDEVIENIEVAAEESVEVQPEQTEEVQLEASEEVAQEESEGGEGGIQVQAETEQELEQELEQAIEEGATKEELTNMVRQFTLKVNNKEYVKEIDLGDDEALQRELQMALAGRQAMQANAEMKKAYNSDFERLKNDPFKVLEELGLDPIELSAKKIEEYLAEKAKTPEQLEAENRQKEYESIKAENERLKKEFEDTKRSAAMAEAEKEIESDIITALDGDTELEASPEVINMVVDNMLWAMNKGFKDVTAKDVLPTVKKEIQEKYRSFAKSMKSTTALKSLLGEDIINTLREERVEKIKKQVNNINNIKPTSKVEKEAELEKPKQNLSSLLYGR